jgi:hypothetical protein
MNTTRREFLFTAAKGVILTASLPLLNACSHIGRESINPGSELSIKKNLLNKDHIEILRYASLAPSGHNTQPWEVEIIELGKWKIKSNPDRWLPVVDPENREGTLSLGPFIENLVFAAGSFGYATEINYLAVSLKEKTVVEVVLTKDKQIEYPLHKIEKRRTVRNNHLKKTISPVDLKFITGNDDASFHFYSADSAQGKLLSEGTLEANKIQALRDDAQRELSEWIRFSNSDAEKYRTGLTPASMEMSGFASLFVRMFYDKDDVMSKSFREKGIEQVEEQINSFGGWLVITSDGNNTESLIEAGRIFQRMALKTREKMIAVHPMMQLLEERFRDKVQSGLGISKPVQFILRTSYIEDYPDSVSLRRPVEWFAT